MVVINDACEKEKRRRLRRLETPEEKFVWKMLRRKNLGMKWRRQVSIGRYVADFYCASKKIAIELDGSQHALDNAKKYDAIRDQFFKSRGIAVIRISNYKLNKDPTALYDLIKNSTP